MKALDTIITDVGNITKDDKGNVTSFAAAPITVVRDGNTFTLDCRAMQKGKEKGERYYGINFDTNTLETNIKNVGKDIIADALDTMINTKMQAFNENALSTAAADSKWNSLDAKGRFELFATELKKNVEAWSMREITTKKITEEMAELGAKLKLPNADVAGISKRLAELAMLYATK